MTQTELFYLVIKIALSIALAVTAGLLIGVVLLGFAAMRFWGLPVNPADILLSVIWVAIIVVLTVIAAFKIWVR